LNLEEIIVNLSLARYDSEEIEIDQDTLIAFPDGLPGFEDCKRFKLFHSGESPVIFWLQSTDDPAVIFSLADPDLLKVYYELTLTDEDLALLRFKGGDELHIAVILSHQEENNPTSQSAILANFRTPIVINVSKRIALQKSLLNAELLIRA
jgi:flagellar assembly factor FliW